MLVLYFLVCLLTGVESSQQCDQATSRQRSTADFLNERFFNKTSGFYLESIYWHDGNGLETVNLYALTLNPNTDSALLERIKADTAITFKETDDMTVLNGTDMNKQLSGFFDDSLWWGLGWAAAYELEPNKPEYFERAELIFEDIRDRSWNETSCGGGAQWAWDDGPAGSGGYYKNAITTELYFALAAKLALVTSDPAKKQIYKEWAEKIW
jgi:hypothetical protein